MAEPIDPKTTEKALDQIDIENQRPVFPQDVEEENAPSDSGASSYAEEGDEVYDKFPRRQKIVITAVVSLCGFLTPIASTTLLPAVPEVASAFHTTGTIINLSNGIFLIFMGFSPVFWGPLSQTYGRRKVTLAALIMFLAFSIGTSLAPDLESFFIFRMLTAFQGTCLLISGASAIGDIYKPHNRAQALGWFMSGALIGPAIGPLVGGIIVTFKSWRDIFWFQSALGGFALVLVYFFFPETIHQKRATQLSGLTRMQYFKTLWNWTNPWRVIVLFKYPNILIADIASSAITWNMYSLLTPIRYVLNPRFGLTSPLQSGLFYIAPGAGYLLGTFFGGWWADRSVRKWIAKRGRRVPEDRLRSALSSLLVVAGCIVLYGWSLEKALGGIPLPVILMFVQGVAQLFCVPSLNTYCLDVMQSRSAEVVAGSHLMRFLFAAAGSSVVLPAIDSIGVGWFSTISALFMVASTAGLLVTTRCGERMQKWVERRDEAAAQRKAEKAAGKQKSEQSVAQNSEMHIEEIDGQISEKVIIQEQSSQSEEKLEDNVSKEDVT